MLVVLGQAGRQIPNITYHFRRITSALLLVGDMASARLFFSPNTPCYAVMRMDPVAMVRKLDDTEAMNAARAMTPQSYVVFLSLISPIYLPPTCPILF